MYNVVYEYRRILAAAQPFCTVVFSRWQEGKGFGNFPFSSCRLFLSHLEQGICLVGGRVPRG